MFQCNSIWCVSDYLKSIGSVTLKIKPCLLSPKVIVVIWCSWSFCLLFTKQSCHGNSSWNSCSTVMYSIKYHIYYLVSCEQYFKGYANLVLVSVLKKKTLSFSSYGLFCSVVIIPVILCNIFFSLSSPTRSCD